MNKTTQHSSMQAIHARAMRQCVILIAVSVAAAFPYSGRAETMDDATQAPHPAKTRTVKPVMDKATPDGKGTGGKGSAQRSAAPVCIGELPASVNMNVPEGKSGVLDLPHLRLPAPSWLRSVGDPEIVQVEPLTSPTARNMFFVFGKKVGTTNLMFQNKDGQCAVVEVSVGVDTAAVQASLQQLLPAEKNIKVSSAADSLVIGGTVSDALAVDKVMNIASAFVRKNGDGGGNGRPNERIVNMMSIGAPQQVMLEVKVAEISRTLLEKIGAGFSANTGKGSWTFNLLSNFLSTSNGAIQAQKGNGDISLGLDAEKKDGLVKILAEPTVMAISGQDGSFLAGGRIFIPVAQDKDGKITLEEKEFGVGLRFTPTVLDGGRINLKVAPEVSELSREGVGITSSGIGGNAVLPLITTRRAATTVQLYDGQSFAIGGLIKNNITENIKALPILGEVPMLGALFRSSDFQNDKTELVFIVTPRLVKPLPPTYPLPTDGFVPPTRQEFFIEGKMEASPAKADNAKPAAVAAETAASAAAPTGFDLK